MSYSVLLPRWKCHTIIRNLEFVEKQLEFILPNDIFKSILDGHIAVEYIDNMRNRIHQVLKIAYGKRELLRYTEMISLEDYIVRFMREGIRYVQVEIERIVPDIWLDASWTEDDWSEGQYDGPFLMEMHETLKFVHDMLY